MVSKAKLRRACTPSLEEKNIRNADPGSPGELSSIAPAVIINIMYAARLHHCDLLFSANALSRKFKIGEGARQATDGSSC